ncbi:MAG: hypothetical protein IPK73_17340 [Candidatus Obscuribacter sp.]|nr:hypothetical protein [Candidatus Obscuribacter sp.]MBK9278601.1 hypothetical protein [Candidatus Obscuribacter sp.]
MPNLQSALMALALLALLALPSPALADETTDSGKAAPAGSLRARFGKAMGRFEGPRDMNIFQVEPSMLNERYYTSGESEHHQFVGNVLPAGAPIPDNDDTMPVKKDRSGETPAAGVGTPNAVKPGTGLILPAGKAAPGGAPAPASKTGTSTESQPPRPDTPSN